MERCGVHEANAMQLRVMDHRTNCAPKLQRQRRLRRDGRRRTSANILNSDRDSDRFFEVEEDITSSVRRGRIRRGGRVGHKKRCSVCKKTGHTGRTCPSASAARVHAPQPESRAASPFIDSDVGEDSASENKFSDIDTESDTDSSSSIDDNLSFYIETKLVYIYR